MKNARRQKNIHDMIFYFWLYSVTGCVTIEQHNRLK